MAMMIDFKSFNNSLKHQGVNSELVNITIDYKEHDMHKYVVGKRHIIKLTFLNNKVYSWLGGLEERNGFLSLEQKNWIKKCLEGVGIYEGEWFLDFSDCDSHPHKRWKYRRWNLYIYDMKIGG